MSAWLLFVLAAASAGATLLWHAVGKSKQTGDSLLDMYARLLGEARERMHLEARPSDDKEEGAHGSGK